jgi:hypothetical protein
VQDYLGLYLELFFSLVIALGFGFQQLWSLRREKERREKLARERSAREATRANDLD